MDNDRDPFFAMASELCPAAPVASCRVAVTPGSDRIKFTNKAGAKDRMSWKWRRGEATTVAEYRSMASTMPLALCFYDNDGSGPRLSLEVAIYGDAIGKNGKPTWTSSASSWAYRDNTRRNSPINKAVLRAGADGKALIKIAARGPTLGLPSMPVAVTPSAVIQLHSLESGVCWSSIFTSVSLNSDRSLKARGD